MSTASPPPCPTSYAPHSSSSTTSGGGNGHNATVSKASTLQDDDRENSTGTTRTVTHSNVRTHDRTQVPTITATATTTQQRHFPAGMSAINMAKPRKNRSSKHSPADMPSRFRQRDNSAEFPNKSSIIHRKHSTIRGGAVGGSAAASSPSPTSVLGQALLHDLTHITSLPPPGATRPREPTLHSSQQGGATHRRSATPNSQQGGATHRRPPTSASQPGGTYSSQAMPKPPLQTVDPSYIASPAGHAAMGSISSDGMARNRSISIQRNQGWSFLASFSRCSSSIV